MRRWKAKGSLTVEAAFVVPLVLFCILLVLNQGLELYEEVIGTMEKQEMWEEFDPAGGFRKFEFLEKVAG